MQEVDGLRRPRAGGPNCFVVRAQHGSPIRDILRMLQSSRDLQLRAEEGRREFGDEFLEGVSTIAEAFAELPREFPLRRPSRCPTQSALPEWLSPRFMLIYDHESQLTSSERPPPP
jgi:hypothetical protein